MVYISKSSNFANKLFIIKNHTLGNDKSSNFDEKETNDIYAKR